LEKSRRQGIFGGKNCKEEFMESITEALNQIDDVLTQVRNFLSEVKDKERFIAKMSAKINTLDAKRVELEASLTKREADFKALLNEKEEKVMAEAQKRAETRVKSLTDAAKAENATLISRNESLTNQIGSLSALFEQKKVEMTSKIKEFEVAKKALEGEIVQLTFAKNELTKQIDAIREKVSTFLT
jgi:chromosome segregation ATPase